jgi:hypothetical protein
MRSLLALLILSILVPRAAALEPGLVKSVVLLQTEGGACATGFRFESDLVITAAHFTDTACPEGRCGNISISGAPDIGQVVSPQPLLLDTPSVRWDFPEFDVAALTFPKSERLPPPYLTAPSPTTNIAGEVFSLGYPRCKKLELTAGSLSNPTVRGWKSSLSGDQGVSGAPVFTGSGQIVGMVRGSATIGGSLHSALLGVLFGGNDVPPNAFQAEVVRVYEPFTWSVLPPRESFFAALTHAEAFHENQVILAQGHQRLWMSLAFQHAVGVIARRFARIEDTRSLVHPFLEADRFPASPPPASDALPTIINRVVLRSQLEHHGLRQGWFTPIQGDARIQKGQYGAVIEAFAEHPFPGSQLMTMTTLFSYILLAGIVGTLWVASLGYVWGRLHGTPLARRLVATGAGIVGGPFFVLLLVRRLRRRNIGRETSAPR